jgi:hypothetical protein
MVMETTPEDDPRNTPIWLRHELIEQGFHDRAIAQQRRQGILARPRRGAYVDGAVWRSLDEPGQHAVTARAVLRQAKTEVVLSHVSALVEYGAPTWGVDLSVVHVTRDDGKAGRKERGIQQHCGRLLPADVVKRNGVRVTSAARLALDMTTLVSTEVALGIMNYLLHEELTSVEDLEIRYASMDQWPYTLATDLVLRLADGRIESLGESRTVHLCFQQQLPRPVPQYEIRDRSGRVVARVDFAWPEHGVFLEFDGKVKYERYLREGESASDAVVREKRREEMIRELTGWRCIRITWADLYTPELTARRIREALFPVDKAA